MSSSPDTKPRTTGAHRTHRTHREARDRAAARTLAQQPLAHYEPYLDGLFTYCLSVLCDHDAATAALGDALVSAERRGQRGPGAEGERRAWLYALARWACLRELAETKQKTKQRAEQKRRGTHAAGHDGTRHGPVRPAAPPVPDEVRQQRRHELTLLAWPEAAGTTPEQREALELAVRHRLAVHEVAAVLGRSVDATRELLAAATCEVERTRAALAVVESGACPSISRLAGDDQVVLSATLRRELVRHVDDCPRCRRVAGRALPGRWPGATVARAELPVLTAPRAALCTALAHHPRARGAGPRFDRRGFPMSPKDHAARRDRLRARAVTTTVVATVVAAPVLALWAAYRDAPLGEGEGHGGPSATAREAHDPGAPDGRPAGGGYQNTGNAAPGPDTRFGAGDGPDVSVEVVSVTGAGRTDGRLTVTASGTGDTTLITLTASGPGPVRWSASTGASWIYLSRTSGTLGPGESLTIRVYIDHLHEPSGPWSARVTIAPAGAVVLLHGRGIAPGPVHSAPASPAGPSPAPDPWPTPSRSASASPTSSPSPSSPPADPPSSDPAPTPTPTGSAPPDPGGGQSPVPGDGDAPGGPSPTDTP
ncbi:hypothetical protein STXM2123_2384 [Streptomyces sp. F-3]|uniref:Alanine-rich protein n=1 Tax=Streptomyces thermogriseus TaxID=75292 RepID=A0ABN1T4C6_9ACTN|nr:MULTISPECIES: hypothetical protein [Streptomyces]MDN5381195.1 hypothetical protein [Streptomyces sp. LB8]GAT81682.1 hypothetical protein STXM2123_2384 [Streptomyces sp. F-3]